jgi:hypothetical protein
MRQTQTFPAAARSNVMAVHTVVLTGIKGPTGVVGTVAHQVPLQQIL